MSKVTHITISLGNGELTLEMADARELFRALKELFGERVKTEYVPYPAYEPWRRPYNPYVPLWASSGPTLMKLSTTLPNTSAYNFTGFKPAEDNKCIGVMEEIKLNGD